MKLGHGHTHVFSDLAVLRHALELLKERIVGLLDLSGPAIRIAGERVEAADLILTATESSDGYTGTVPEQLAEVLGLPSVTFAKRVVIANGTLNADRQTESGYDEVTCPLPVMVAYLLPRLDSTD